MSLEIFENPIWQMSLGERAAIEGVLTQLKPSLAIEIGSMGGACLRRIGAHAGEAHSFDFNPPSLPMPGNVVLHTGDSHALLPQFLAELAEEGRNVDFVIVDGDHSSEGVRRDIEDLLDSAALARTLILIHDTANECVRRGVDAVRFSAWPKVCHVQLDWIPGQLFAEPGLRNELWYGLGLIMVDSARPAYRNGSVYEQRYHPAARLLAEVRDLVVGREQVPASARSPQAEAQQLRKRLTELTAQLSRARTREEELRRELVVLCHRIEGAERAIHNITGSASWRMTEPLRTAKRQVRRVKR
jgi:Methyltransferase domain